MDNSKLLVSCDHYAFNLKGVYYVKESGITLLNRYLKVFKSVRFAVRVKYVDNYGELGVHIFEINNSHVEIFELPFFQGPSQYLRVFLNTKKRSKNAPKGCDAAIFRLPSTVGFEVLKQAKKHKLPYAVEIIANPKESAKLTKNWKNFVLLSLIHRELKQVVRSADGVSYVTKSTLQKAYPTMGNPKFESYYSSVELSEDFYSTPRVLHKGSTYVLCHVSNQIKSENKGYSVAIKVLKLLILNNPQFVFQLKFTGYGPLIPELKFLADKLGIIENIEFTGHLKLNDLRKLLLSSHFMIFPTKSEGLPRCILEAGATGLPVVSAPVGGIPELLPPDFLIEPEDVDGFYKKIQSLLNSPDKYAQESSRLFKLSKEYTSSLLNERRETFYRQLKNLIS